MGIRRSVMAFGLVLGIAVSVSGQQRYQPQRPTLSPYLNYFRADVGLLDRHNTLVAPEIRSQQAVQQLQGQVFEQRSQLGNLQGQVDQIREPQTRRTGTASSFMNYSHYYRITAPDRPRGR